MSLSLLNGDQGDLGAHGGTKKNEGPTRNQIREKVIEVVREQLGLSMIHDLPLSVSEGGSFTTDLGADSLDNVEISLVLEDAFHPHLISFSHDEIKDLDDVLSYVDLIHTKLSKVRIY